MADEHGHLLVREHYVDGMSRSLEVLDAPSTAAISAEVLVDLEYCPRNTAPDGRAWFDGEVLHIHAMGGRYRYRVFRRHDVWKPDHFPMVRIDGGTQVHG